MGRWLVVVALTGDQKENPLRGHLLLTLCQSRIYFGSQLLLLFQLEMPEVMVMMSFLCAMT